MSQGINFTLGFVGPLLELCFSLGDVVTMSAWLRELCYWLELFGRDARPSTRILPHIPALFALLATINPA